MSQPIPDASRRALPVVVAVTGMGVLTFSLIAPALPDLADALGVSRSQIGLVQSAVAVPGIVLALFIGYAYDLRGRRAVAAASLLVFGLAGLAGFFARTFWALIVVRALQGIGTSGILSLGVIVIGDLFPPGYARRWAIGINSAALTMTGMVAPILGGALAQVDPFAPFLVFGIALPLAVLAGRRLPGGRDDAHPPQRPVAHLRGMAAELRAGRRFADFAGLMAFGTFALIVFAGIGFTTTPLYLEAEFGLAAAARGGIQALLSVGSTTASLTVARASRRFGNRRVFGIGITLIMLAFVSLAAAPSLVVAGTGLLLLGLGLGLSFPLVQEFVTSSVSTAHRGAAVGAFVMAVRLGQSIGPLLAGIMADAPGTRATYLVGGVATLAFLVVWQPARRAARHLAGEPPVSRRR